MSFSEIFGEGTKRTATAALFKESNVFVKSPEEKTVAVSKPPKQKRKDRSEMKKGIPVDVNQRTLFVGNLSLAVKQLPKKLKRLCAA